MSTNTEKKIKTRLIHKHDIELNWNKAVNFIPLKGEIIVYDVDDIHTQERFKIGDGVNLVTNLPFVKNSSNIISSDLGGNNSNGIVKGFRFTKTTKDYDYQYNTHTSKKLEDGVNYGTYEQPIQTIKMYVDSIEGINTSNPYPVYSIFGFDKNGEPDRIHRGFITGKGVDDNGNYVILQTQSGEGALYKIFDDLANSHNQGYGENSIVMALIVEGGTIGSFEVIDDLNYFSQHTEGYKTTAGINAHAGGNESKALGYSSFATGNKSVARGERGFAINYKTQANGMETFAANDQTKANGKGAFATGEKTEANGNYSFTDGSKTKAIGDYSRAGGVGSEARGVGASAEGDNTKASSAYQHVQGKHNIEDAEDKYAHIVGNGHITEDGEIIKRNAHTIDWNGVGWFAQGVKVGGMSQEDGAEYLVTETDLDNVKNDLDDKINNKVNTDTFNIKTTELQTSINNKADKSSITSLQTELNKKASSTSVSNLQNELNKKVNIEDIFPKNIALTVSGNITGDKHTSLNNHTIISENDTVANYLEDGKISFKILANGNGVQTQNYPKLKVPIEPLTLQPGTYSKTTTYNTGVFKRLNMCGYYVNFITDELKETGNIIENQDYIVVTDTTVLNSIEIKTDYASGQWGPATQITDEGYLEINISIITDMTPELIGAGSKKDINRINEELNQKINRSEITNVYKFKGSVTTFDDLPTEDLTVGDVYNVLATDVNYAWSGTEWDSLGGSIEDQATKEQLDLKANKSDVYTKLEMETKLNKKANISDISSVFKYVGSVNTFDDLPYNIPIVADGFPVTEYGEPLDEYYYDYDENSKTITIHEDAWTYHHIVAVPIKPINMKAGYWVAGVSLYDESLSHMVGIDYAYLEYIDEFTAKFANECYNGFGHTDNSYSIGQALTYMYKPLETDITTNENGNMEGYTNVEVGHVYNILSTGINYAYSGDQWCPLSGAHIDVEAREDIKQLDEEVSNKANKSETYTKLEVNTKLNAKANLSDISSVYKFKASVDTFDNLPFEYHVVYDGGLPLTMDGEPLDESYYTYNLETKTLELKGNYNSVILIPIKKLNLTKGTYGSTNPTFNSSSEQYVYVVTEDLISNEIRYYPFFGDSVIHNDIAIKYIEVDGYVSCKLTNGDLMVSITKSSPDMYSYDEEWWESYQTEEFTPGITIGSVYNVLDTGLNYAWTGAGWNELGNSIEDKEVKEQLELKADKLYVDDKIRDIASTYYTKEEVDNLIREAVQEYVQSAILNGEW